MDRQGEPQDIVLILSTAPTMEAARALAEGLVREQLCACVNLVPAVTSIYRWEGKIEVESEVQLLIKTRALRVDEVEAWLVEHHPYDVPELVTLSAKASAAYGAFVLENT